MKSSLSCLLLSQGTSMDLLLFQYQMQGPLIEVCLVSLSNAWPLWWLYHQDQLHTIMQLIVLCQCKLNCNIKHRILITRLSYPWNLNSITHLLLSRSHLPFSKCFLRIFRLPGKMLIWLPTSLTLFKSWVWYTLFEFRSNDYSNSNLLLKHNQLMKFDFQTSFELKSILIKSYVPLLWDKSKVHMEADTWRCFLLPQ